MNLLLRSLYLDLKFFKLPISIFEKIIFIIKKYLIIVKNSLVNYKIGKSSITVFDHKYFYYDKYGIAFLQSVFTENIYLTKYIKPESIVIDIGAHVGEFNIFCKNILKTSRVLSIEPLSESYRLLIKNIDSKAFNYAISTHKTPTLYTPDTTIMSSVLKGDSKKEEVCTGIGLDDIKEVKTLKKVNLLKIDTEGAEYNILLTAKKTLLKTEFLFIEASIQRLSTGDLFDIFRVIRKYCPKSSVIHVGNPFVLQNKTVCVDILFKCRP
ncbi:MAG: methyltransferase FkbM family [uncultured bacterium]|nr:MAG: methyltransferase FkbM family [uncultured bacterium]